VQLDRAACDRARHSRDARFDGRFFIAVTTTGIYCRPICPARAPNDGNVRYFPTASAAQAAGFRPCLRCRPEASPGTPAWFGTSSVVARALRLISDGALDGGSVDRLADRLGITGRHLRRLFVEHLGATPLDVAVTRRVHAAKRLLDETSLPCHRVAMAAGFGSLRRFNGEMRRIYKRTPTELRALARRRGRHDSDHYTFRLAYRPPYDWNALLAFLSARATPGVESADGNQYRRTITIGGQHGTIEVSPDTPTALRLRVRFPDPQRLLLIVERVRRMFDLGAVPAVVAEHLASDPLLRARLRAHPGIRTPGAWDGFELAVRAILGQQISVRGATTIAGRVAAMFGSPIAGDKGLDRLFPTPRQLVSAGIEQAGVVRARAQAIRSLAREAVEDRLTFDGLDPRATAAALLRIPGIGPWTAEYIAMRALGEPDAFPSGDLVLRRELGHCTARELERRSDAWRPWRAYAVMLLWQEGNHERSRNTDAVERRLHPIGSGRRRDAIRSNPR
jgi:AraC family transcriptional regulator of adaptative response / DNA-3-methyladenine glycosylase II